MRHPLERKNRMNTYEETEAWIHSLLPFGIKPGLKRMEWMLERLGSPEKEVPFIHIGETNGNGSTVAFLREILLAANYNVGTFTSPYVEQFTERISFNGVPIADQDLVTIANEIRPLAEELAETDLGSPTEFEVLTTIAFIYYAKVAKPDIVLLEVGLGGKFDSTNVINPLVSIITNVGYDHMHILGDKIEEIAYQKAGIIKSGVPLITAAENEEVIKVLHKEATKMNASLYQFGKQFMYEKLISTSEQQTFQMYTNRKEKRDVTITMLGEHQVKNAAVAIMAIDFLSENNHVHVSESALLKGLKRTSWLGRFEKMQEKPLVFIDGAHNKEGIEALAMTLKANFSDKKIHVIFAATKEKKVDSMLAPLYPLIREICFTSFDFLRAQRSIDLYEQSSYVRKNYEDNWTIAVKRTLEGMKEDEMLIVTGSLYFISEVRRYFV